MMDFFPANFMLQTPSDSNQPTPDSFHGVGPILGKRSMSYSGINAFHDEVNSGGEEENFSDDGSQLGEKKRRLNMEQVKTLEKTFELGNKLDPERKVQLAKALGLQPRQIAIWFQNRRARWKTKQLEIDYESLRAQFESLKAHNESLLAQNHKLQSEIAVLRGREGMESINLNKDTDQGSCSNRSESGSEAKMNKDTLTAAAIESRTVLPCHKSAGRGDGGAMPQLFQSPPPVKEEGFTSMFCGIDDQSPAFWPWVEHPHNFN